MMSIVSHEVEMVDHVTAVAQRERQLTITSMVDVLCRM
jgi:hypothetical protein